VRLGLAIFATDESVTPGWLATRAEEAGFESVFFPEHTHIPASRLTPYPPGGELPREYTRLFDPFVAATHAAAATETIRIGIGVCLAAQHDPITCAKAAASLDHLSGGRLLFGVGAGWNEEEMRNHGVEPRNRFERVREHVEAMQAIWRDDEATYEGRHVHFERIWSWPKPIQRPGPSILVGGNGPRVLDRALAYGDHWMPNAVGDDDTLLARVDALRTRAADAGRTIGVTLNAASSRPQRLERYARARVERCVFYVPSAGADQVEAKIVRVLESAASVGLAP
jgi:probable F420-dependent oxidoreductase